MAGGRGLSIEEKRTKLLEIFHETKDFFTRQSSQIVEPPVLTNAPVKELEKLGAKKGVVSQTVKDVLQTLVDDNLVELDKIGISNYYWSFPSARGAALTNKVNNAESEVKALEYRELELRQGIATAQAERPTSNEREELLATWRNLKTRLADAQTELAQFSDSSGTEAKVQATELAREAALRWTDNLSIVVQYISTTFSMSTEEIRKLGGIPDDFEDLVP